MDILILLIRGAGVVHLLIALAGLIAPRMLDYRAEMAGVSPTVREIFFIHNGYMTLFVLAFAIACLAFPADLAGASGLGRFLSGFLGAIWLLRVLIQFFYHNAEIKRAHPVFNALFTAAFLYLGVVLSLAAAGWGGGPPR